MNAAALQHLTSLWRRQSTTRSTLIALAAGIVASAAVIRTSVLVAIAAGAGVAVVTWLVLHRRSRKVTSDIVAAHLNRLCPSLEESATLWLKDGKSLSLLEDLQRRRLDAAWAALPESATLGRPPQKKLAAPAAAALLALLILAATFPRLHPLLPADKTAEAPIKLPIFNLTPSRQGKPALVKSVLTLAPPAYLGEKSRTIDGLDAEAPEGSLVTWDISTSGDVATLTLEDVGAKNTVVTRPIGPGKFHAQIMLNENRLYQIAVTGSDRAVTRWPEVHTLKVIRDQPPQVAWQIPALPRTIVEVVDQEHVAIKLKATDDHALGELRLIMTVAKGSGEGVKFREREVTLSPTTQLPRERSYTSVLNLRQLGLEPGDELYLYAVATDTKTPAANRTRSETRFLVLRGPDTTASDPGTTIAGVNRVPQYFRSQRQLIIDTERLIAERPRLTEEKFRTRSEDIGVDQKLLRLRYGQFLGEEFDPESSNAAPEARGMKQAAQLRTGRRNEAERANSVERVVEQQHDHKAAPTQREQPATLEEIRAPFVHNHDSSEAATLFESKVKASLREVLSAMWEAEGLLRTVQPERALPAENRALEMLKELQQADRVYVKRVGFEPAPLKAERRLQGELAAIPARAQTPLMDAPINPAATALRESLAALSTRGPLNLSVKATTLAEQELTRASLREPEKFVGALEIWKRRSASLSADERSQLQRALWLLMPPATETPQQSVEPASALAKKYFDAIGDDSPQTR